VSSESQRMRVVEVQRIMKEHNAVNPRKGDFVCCSYSETVINPLSGYD
jgi:hypothetical protein